jgi:hypothetical protein
MGLRRVLFVSSLLVVAACGPKEPPRQASGSDTPDPMNDPNAAPSSDTSPKGKESAGPPPSAAGGKVAVGKGTEPPQVASLATFLDGVKWGTSHAELTKQFTQTGGVLWKDYDEKLTKARVGPEQTALEAEREQAKGAFSRSYVEFKDTPTGYDTTGIRGEFSYRNKEALMWVQRKGKKRYFFFIADRLWKVYDEVPLGEGSPFGATFLDAVNHINGQLNAQGRMKPADPAKGTYFASAEWKDGTSHMRAIDRSGDHMVGIVVEESATLSNLNALRPNKMPDPNEIDPSVTAVTKPRAEPSAAPSASAAPGKKTPPKK